MGVVQSDHSKSYTLTIKVPNPVVTFIHFPPDEYNFEDLQRNVQCIAQSSNPRQFDFVAILQKVFAFVEKSQSVMREKILLQSNRVEFKDADNQLTELSRHTTILNKVFQALLQDDLSEEDRAEAVDEGLTSSQSIVRYFSDENGIFSANFFLVSPCIVGCAGIIQSFAKNWLADGERTTLTESLKTILDQFAEKCIQERLANIKMLRNQSVSYNVHDYSYEAQVRKDTTFGGKINDFYDKRQTTDIAYRGYPLNQVSDADLILDGFRNEVKEKYEQFFNAGSS